MTGDITVHIGEGVYPLAGTLTFDERDGATNNEISYAPYTGIYMDEQTAGYTVKDNVTERGWGVGRNRNGENDYREKTIYIDDTNHPAAVAIKKNAGINPQFDACAKLYYRGINTRQSPRQTQFSPPVTRRGKGGRR